MQRRDWHHIMDLTRRTRARCRAMCIASSCYVGLFQVCAAGCGVCPALARGEGTDGGHTPARLAFRCSFQSLCPSGGRSRSKRTPAVRTISASCAA